MLRIFTVLAFLATLGMAGVVYKLKYETRGLQIEAAKLRRQIALERNLVAVLKAEWSILTNPQRLETIAEDFGLAPVQARQIISPKDIDRLPITGRQSTALLPNKAELQSEVEGYDNAAALNGLIKNSQPGEEAIVE